MELRKLLFRKSKMAILKKINTLHANCILASCVTKGSFSGVKYAINKELM